MTAEKARFMRAFVSFNEGLLAENRLADASPFGICMRTLGIVSTILRVEGSRGLAEDSFC